MNWILFWQTFGMIFLAELGDKTQIAAFAAAAGCKNPWVVFAGSSFALILSSFIAVFAAGQVARLLPPHYLKIGAGILFIVFGVLFLWQGLGIAKTVNC